MPTRRSFLKLTGATTLAWYVATQTGWTRSGRSPRSPAAARPRRCAEVPDPMLIPPVMPRAATITMPGGKPADYYEISMKQISEQILPAGLPATTVWGYGAVTKSATSRGLVRFWHAPSLTIESTWKRPVRIKWINELVDANGNYLPTCCRWIQTCTGPTHPAAPTAATCARRSPPRPVPTPARCRS